MTNYQMPKGVEHESRGYVDNAGQHMTNYQMPKGVEHARGYAVDMRNFFMTNYQMPKGVEHSRARRSAPPRPDDELSDAERR